MGFYVTLGGRFEDVFFPDGVPSPGYYEALNNRVMQRNGGATFRQRLIVSRDMTADGHQVLAAEFNNSQPSPQLRRHKKAALVVAATADEDDHAVELFSEAFKKLRLGTLDCIFWKNPRETESDMKPPKENYNVIPLDQVLNHIVPALLLPMSAVGSLVCTCLSVGPDEQAGHH